MDMYQTPARRRAPDTASRRAMSTQPMAQGGFDFPTIAGTRRRERQEEVLASCLPMRVVGELTRPEVSAITDNGAVVVLLVSRSAMISGVSSGWIRTGRGGWIAALSSMVRDTWCCVL